MTNIVYADVLFLYHVLINLTLFFMVQTILGQTIRISRTLLWTILMAALSTGIFGITRSNSFLYYILYGICCFFMTYFFTKCCRAHASQIVVLLTVIGCCIWLAGMLELFRVQSRHALHNPLFFEACIISILLCRIVRCLYERRAAKKKNYVVELVFPDKTIRANAFLDTGNRLKNPYTNKPAIVIDYHLLKQYLPEQSYAYLVQYHKTGHFSYTKMNGNGTLSFYPLPYHTIGNRFSFMPAITVPKLVYKNEHAVIYAVTAGISRESFFENQYDVLLNEKLQPIKEEPV